MRCESGGHQLAVSRSVSLWCDSVLRTYSYDTNPYDANYSQYSAGRLTAIQYPSIGYNEAAGQAQNSTTAFTDMFSYSQPGSVTGKRLRMTKIEPYTLSGQQHTQTAVGDLNLAYAHNYEGQLSMVTYPTDAYGATPQFTYSFDTMMRPSGMTDQTNYPVVSNVTYGPANELLHMIYYGRDETCQYNSMLQLTNITTTLNSYPMQNVTYTFPAAGANAGKIMSQTDNMSGETINYLYDSLNRLTSAAASGWSQSYTYDGFGNLINRAGTGTAQSTTISTPADAATNRLSGYTYDFNGNQISTGYTYDAENRLVQANAGTTHYAYDAQNKRIWQATFSNQSGAWVFNNDSISLFGIDGKLIGTYTAGAAWNNIGTQLPLSFYVQTQRAYFGKKLVASGQTLGPAVQDRLGSVGKYYPFGEDRNTTYIPNDQVKFATYTRDSATSLDYADQRYYASTFGRFMTADPYQASGGPKEPGSWNRYAYSINDPVNFFDPSGLERCGSSFSDNGNGVISITVYDCIGFLPYLSPSYVPNTSPRPVIIADNSGVPSLICPSLPELPVGITSDQLQSNINEAHQFFDLQVSAAKYNPDADPLLALFGFLTNRFLGAWDYKKQYDSASDVEKAKDFANFNFGAVLESLGFNYFFTQNAAGVAQIGICKTGGYCGEGTPGVVFPFGDSIDDAVNVKRGFNYQRRVDRGCTP